MMIRIVIMLGIYMYMYVALVFCSLLMRNLFTVLQRVNSSFSHPLLDSFSGDSFFTPWNETSLYFHTLCYLLFHVCLIHARCVACAWWYACYLYISMRRCVRGPLELSSDPSIWPCLHGVLFILLCMLRSENMQRLMVWCMSHRIHIQLFRNWSFN